MQRIVNRVIAVTRLGAITPDSAQPVTAPLLGQKRVSIIVQLGMRIAKLATAATGREIITPDNAQPATAPRLGRERVSIIVQQALRIANLATAVTSREITFLDSAQIVTAPVPGVMLILITSFQLTTVLQKEIAVIAILPGVRNGIVMAAIARTR